MIGCQIPGGIITIGEPRLSETKAQLTEPTGRMPLRFAMKQQQALEGAARRIWSVVPLCVAMLTTEGVTFNGRGANHGTRWAISGPHIWPAESHPPPWYNADMVDRTTFFEHVRDAFAHLHDLSYLRRHPLARLLAGADKTLYGDGLRRVLLDAIEQLKPPPDAPSDSVSWRRYRYLRLRYLNGASREAICRELLISPRQASRDHHEALEATSLVLWESYRALSDDRKADVQVVTKDGSSLGSPIQHGSLDAELARAGFEVRGEQATDLNEALAGVAEIAVRLAESQGRSLRVLIPPSLPPVDVSRTMLRQVLLSLLSYAFGITSASQLALTAADCGTTVRLRIDAFETVDRQNSVASPVDFLGENATLLATALHLAELSGISVEPIPGSAQPLPIEVVVSVAHPSTVLVIDDNPDVAILFERYLTGTTFRLRHAKTWQQALELVEEHPPDIVTLDVMMPSLDGWDVLRQLKDRSDTREVPVIVCSVLPERSVALALGVTEFLAKPVTRQALLTALHRCQSRQEPAHRGQSSYSASLPRLKGQQGG